MAALFGLPQGVKTLSGPERSAPRVGALLYYSAVIPGQRSVPVNLEEGGSRWWGSESEPEYQSHSLRKAGSAVHQNQVAGGEEPHSRNGTEISILRHYPYPASSCHKPVLSYGYWVPWHFGAPHARCSGFISFLIASSTRIPTHTLILQTTLISELPCHRIVNGK